jgi:uncharacterized circularly permuted ATP-grasp superfamily protein
MRGYDEAYDADGAARPAYRKVLAALGELDLDVLSREVCRRAAATGADFGDRPFALDPVPRIIGAGERERLRAGLAQRARALGAFVVDAYGERRICAAGVVEPRVIDEAEGYEADLQGRWPAGAIPIGVAGLDLVRDERGELLVLEDNVRMPSGFAYASTANAVLDDLLPNGVVRHADEAPILLAGLADVFAAPEGETVVLGDGPDGSAHFEHAATAHALGAPLVTLGDLHRDRDGVVRRDERGARHRVATVYRRCSAERLRAEDGSATPLAETLLQPWLDGQVAVVNGFGTGIADDKLSHAHVEGMIRFYLGEEPILRSVPTLDLADADARAAVLDDLRAYVVKPRDGYGGHGVVICGDASEEDVRAVADDLRRAPETFVAQRTIALSHHPTVVDGTLVPRHVDLRPFVFTSANDVRVLTAGLTRVAWGEDALVVNSSQQGGAKPTWVLAHD